MLKSSKRHVEPDRQNTTARVSEYPTSSYRFRSIMGPTQTQRMMDDLAKSNEARELCERLCRFKNLNDMDEAQLRSSLGRLVTWFGASLEGRYIVKDHEELAGILDDIVSWPEIGKSTKQSIALLSEAFRNTPKEAWEKDGDQN